MYNLNIFMNGQRVRVVRGKQANRVGEIRKTFVVADRYGVKHMYRVAVHGRKQNYTADYLEVSRGR